MTIIPEQCRAARALLNWSQTDLAEAAEVGQSTVAKFEHGARIPHATNLAAIQAALEAAGITFLNDENPAGPGLRHRPPEDE